MTKTEVWELSGRIYDSKPDRLVFIDHLPHPEALLRALAQRYGQRPLPPIFVHVYGDFTLYTSQWLAVEDILKRTRLLFICASLRQTRLLSRFLSSPEDSLGCCPFPVDITQYNSDPRLRAIWRQKLGLRNEEYVILYTGRLSLQKNILRLTDEIISFGAATKIPIRFLLAGTFDDLGAPFFGIHLHRGFYNQYWLQEMNKVPEEFRDKIQYLGNVGPDVLKGLYNAADSYVSLSLHHDEDYGMSPAEALCCGTPAVLSDWGGYASFSGEHNDCSMVDVKIGSRGLLISSEAFQRSLFIQSSAEHTAAARKSRSHRYHQRLSIEAASGIISQLHSKEPPHFAGFNWRMQKFVECFSKNIAFPGGPRQNSFYEEIYGTYTGKA